MGVPRIKRERGFVENKRGFASDNNSGVHPRILEAIRAANVGHVVGYGDDPYTDEAKYWIKKHFGETAEAHFVFNGTGANVLSIRALAESYHSVICSDLAHLNVDECGAPERITGCKLIPVPSRSGKITVEDIQPHLHGFGFEHHSQPRIVSITQVSEMGTIYTPEEIREIADFVHSHNMFLHMDGARLCNAAASLGCGLIDITANVGVDVLSFGGTKNGLLLGESVVFFNGASSQNFKYFRKQCMQLGSKMRYFSAQFSEWLKDDLWRELAAHANAMAQQLAAAIRDIPGVQITQPVQANGVFAIVPKEIIEDLRNEFFFYMWDDLKSEARWMTSWDTTAGDIERFSALLKKLLAAS